jgi:predicted DNA-binding transcriptional regulator YafY
MTRTSRLFTLMDELRARRRPVAAAVLAARMSVSVRTIYRDIQTLIDLGALIDGNVGVGYSLRSGFFLPPLMFSEDEIEALVLGMRWVQVQGDVSLAKSADTAIAKIAAASPKDLREQIAETGLFAPRFKGVMMESSHLSGVREAIRLERKMKLRYTDRQGAATERVVWPIALGFFEGMRVFAAWCELRKDFRHFRADRVAGLETLSARYPQPRKELAKRWRLKLRAPGSDRLGS